eukprot:GHVR01083603.1.p1 GENE.GHVR01083603.1~~GHVR01083603.1.p1  ORF type:complete len:258 (-),score=66.62 GHVR01083603.1:56-829(-)
MSSNSFSFFDIQSNNQTNNLRCRVHPAVILTILDAYARKDKINERAIGALIGRVADGNVVEITDCHTVVHGEDAEEHDSLVRVLTEHHEAMVKLKTRANKKDQLVGWFCAGPPTVGRSTIYLFQYFGSKDGFFAAQPSLTQPVHLLVDPSFKTKKIEIKAFTLERHSITECLFRLHELNVEIDSLKDDRAAYAAVLDVCLKASGSKEPVPIENDEFEVAINSLSDLLSTAKKYVDDVQVCVCVFVCVCVGLWVCVCV